MEEIGGTMMEWVDIMQRKLGFSTESEDTPPQESSIEYKASDPIKFVSKGWGYEKWIANCPEYCGKILFIAQGKRCSWHYHQNKDEVFYVQRGVVEVIYSKNDNDEIADKILLCEGDKFHVPRGMRHQMYALRDTEILEFSTEHRDEDSHRIKRGD
jgi:mannose-6-phosphate isomerase-like protein (cupin superfamily)